MRRLIWLSDRSSAIATASNRSRSSGSSTLASACAFVKAMRPSRTAARRLSGKSRIGRRLLTNDVTVKRPRRSNSSRTASRSRSSTFRDVMRAPRSDVLVLLITFLLTVLIDLTVAIHAGMVLAAFLFMKRMADVTDVTTITGTLGDPEHPSGDESGAVYRRTLPKGVEVYEINGPFFFGVAGELLRIIDREIAPARMNEKVVRLGYKL